MGQDGNMHSFVACLGVGLQQSGKPRAPIFSFILDLQAFDGHIFIIIKHSVLIAERKVLHHERVGPKLVFVSVDLSVKLLRLLCGQLKYILHLFVDRIRIHLDQ